MVLLIKKGKKIGMNVVFICLLRFQNNPYEKGDLILFVKL